MGKLDETALFLYHLTMISAVLLSMFGCMSVGQGQDQIHPALRIDPTAMEAAYDRGRNQAKKKVKPRNFSRTWERDLGKVRSPSGQSWRAPYAILLTPLVQAEGMGFKDEKEYEDDSKFRAMIKSVKDSPPSSAERHLRFYVDLFAWPGKSDWDDSIIRGAREADVKSVKFVVLIDGQKPLHPIVRPNPTAEATMDGTVSIPEANTIYSNSSSQVYGNVIGPGGFATGSATGWSSSTVTYFTNRIQAYNAYEAVYFLEFPLFDPSGKCYITPDTKQVVLKVVREDGEHTGVFVLDDFLAKSK